MRQLREETMAWYYCKRSIPDGFYVGITKKCEPTSSHPGMMSERWIC